MVANPPLPRGGRIQQRSGGGGRAWPARRSGSRRSPRRSGGRRSGCPSRCTWRSSPGPSRASRSSDNVAAFGELGFRPHIADLPREREQATTVLGQDISFPVIISPTGVQAVTRRARWRWPGPRPPRAPRWGCARSPAKPIEDVAAANPKTFFQSYWVGRPGRDPAARRAGPGGRRQGADRHPGLDVRHPPGLGQPAHPGEDRPQGDAASSRPEGIVRPRWLLDLVRNGALPDLTCPNLAEPGRGRAHVLRRLRRVDDHPAADLGGPRLAARAVGRPVHGQGDHAPGRRPAGGRHRRHRDLGVQPRRQQPGRHPGLDPGAARGRRRGRRPDRGAARRRHPARQRRGQGARPRAPGRC